MENLSCLDPQLTLFSLHLVSYYIPELDFFIVEIGVSRLIIADKSTSGSVRAPINFRKTQQVFQYENQALFANVDFLHPRFCINWLTELSGPENTAKGT